MDFHGQVNGALESLRISVQETINAWEGIGVIDQRITASRSNPQEDPSEILKLDAKTALLRFEAALKTLGPYYKLLESYIQKAPSYDISRICNFLEINNRDLTT